MEKKLVLFTIAVAFLESAFLYFLNLEWNFLYFVYLIYFFIFTLVMNRQLIAKVDQRPQSFVTSFMGFMAAKLFISLILLLVTLWFNKDIKIPLALFFLLTYLLYTVFSITNLFSRLRKKDN